MRVNMRLWLNLFQSLQCRIPLSPRITVTYGQSKSEETSEQPKLSPEKAIDLNSAFLDFIKNKPVSAEFQAAVDGVNAFTKAKMKEPSYFSKLCPPLAVPSVYNDSQVDAMEAAAVEAAAVDSVNKFFQTKVNEPSILNKLFPATPLPVEVLPEAVLDEPKPFDFGPLTSVGNTYGVSKSWMQPVDLELPCLDDLSDGILSAKPPVLSQDFECGGITKASFADACKLLPKLTPMAMSAPMSITANEITQAEIQSWLKEDLGTPYEWSTPQGPSVDVYTQHVNKIDWGNVALSKMTVTKVDFKHEDNGLVTESVSMSFLPSPKPSNDFWDRFSRKRRNINRTRYA